MLPRPVLVAALVLTGCIPEIESSTTETPYPLIDFNGPDTVPGAPSGTFGGFDLEGPWRVVGVQHQDGDPAVDHLFEPGWFLVADRDTVSTIQGLPPDWFLPSGLEWKRNTIDRDQLVLGFGFTRPRGDLAFLHYAFVMAGVDEHRARAIEAFHFGSTTLGNVVWSIWTVELERVQPPPDVLPAPVAPVWPR